MYNNALFLRERNSPPSPLCFSLSGSTHYVLQHTQIVLSEIATHNQMLCSKSLWSIVLWCFSLNASSVAYEHSPSRALALSPTFGWSIDFQDPSIAHKIEYAEDLLGAADARTHERDGIRAESTNDHTASASKRRRFPIDGTLEDFCSLIVRRARLHGDGTITCK